PWGAARPSRPRPPRRSRRHASSHARPTRSVTCGARCERRVGSDAVELEHADRVAAQDLVALLLVLERLEHLLAVLLGVRPLRVGVRVVGLEADVVLTDLV